MRYSKSTIPFFHQLFTESAPQFPLNPFPIHVKPYLDLIRLEKPTGAVLMFWPFAWGLTMAAFATSLSLDKYIVCLLESMIGAFILRSSACTINDIFDKEMDAGVARTKNRPLASGRISVYAATVCLLVQYLIGTAFYFYTMRGLALYTALFQLLPLFGVYPLLKRITHWPQAWLGFAMNFGLITAWVSVTDTFNAPLLCIAMTGCWCWTMLYDTIYACQDIKDDVKMGIHSTAILFGSWIQPLLMLCAVGFVGMLATAGYLNRQGPPYFVLSVAGTAAHLIWQFMTVDLNDPASCWKNFKRNGGLGWIVWGGLILDYLWMLSSRS